MRTSHPWSFWLSAYLELHCALSAALVPLEGPVQAAQTLAQADDTTNTSIPTSNLTQYLPLNTVPTSFTIVPLTLGRPVSAPTYYLTTLENLVQLAQRNLDDPLTDWHGTGELPYVDPPLAMRAWPTTALPIHLRIVYYALVRLTEESFLAHTGGWKEMRIQLLWDGREIARLDLSSRSEEEEHPFSLPLPAGNTSVHTTTTALTSDRKIRISYAYDATVPLSPPSVLGGLTQALAYWVPSGPEAYQEGFQLTSYGLTFTALNLATPEPSPSSAPPYEVENSFFMSVLRSAAFQQARVGRYMPLRVEFSAEEEGGRLVGTLSYARGEGGV